MRHFEEEIIDNFEVVDWHMVVDSCPVNCY